MFAKVENQWDNGLRCGARRPRLLVVDGDGEVYLFAGENIPGVLAVTGESYNKNGKWSSTTYRFAINRGCVAVEALAGLHQRPFDEFGLWADLHSAFERAAGRSVSSSSTAGMSSLERVIRAEYPKASARLDERVAARASLDNDGDEAADVVLSAFSPNMLHLDEMVEVKFFPLTVDEARRLADGAPSAVGHEDTARVFSAELGVGVAFNRVTATLQSGVVALVGQYRGPRLAEGATSLPEGATIQWLKVEVM